MGKIPVAASCSPAQRGSLPVVALSDSGPAGSDSAAVESGSETAVTGPAESNR